MRALPAMEGDAEPVLIATLQRLSGQRDGDDRLGLVAFALSDLSLPAGRDAVMGALASARTDKARTVLCWALIRFPANDRSVRVFKEAYAKISPDATVDVHGNQIRPRSLLAQISPGLSDPALTDWLISNAVAIKQAGLAPLVAAIELMTPEREAAVRKAVAGARRYMPGTMIDDVMSELEQAAGVLRECKRDADCYVGLMDDSQEQGRVHKAGRMIAIYGSGPRADQLRASLLRQLSVSRRASLRDTILEAILELAPHGDRAAADAMDKMIVHQAKPSGLSQQQADDMLRLTALRLRARMPVTPP